ncbi:CDGSH iron-sulfur domain-containing protein [Nocardioides sp.]|uniref:CDGSH iron-sulfur domain-containing protein n=1 Tax=Nocardioides sp. TaxID=35761 RepID=UPI0035168BD2
MRGASIVADTDGQLHRVTRPVVALCACGRSRIAPWCDSTHKLLHRRAGADDA